MSDRGVEHLAAQFGKDHGAHHRNEVHRGLMAGAGKLCSRIHRFGFHQLGAEELAVRLKPQVQAVRHGDFADCQFA
jgi:hypothetical protein